MLPKLFEKSFLEAAERFALLRQWGECLEGGDVQILSKGQAKHIQILTTITEGTRQGHKHWRERRRE